MRHLLLSTVAFATLAGVAFAADLPARKEEPVYIPPPPVFSWTGFYIGADIGGGWANASANNAFGTFNSGNAGGVVGGGRIGYNYQINQFVLGIEGDFYGTGISNTRYFPTIDTTIKVSQDWLASLNGRLGYAAWDRTLVYAIGGVAWTQGSGTYTAGSTFGPVIAAFGYPNSIGVNHNYTGYDVGGGVEYAFTPNWIGRVEYRYYGFGSWNYPGNYWLSRTQASLNDNVVTVGLSYKFGAPEPVVAKY